jgi:hypothetical protein
MPSFTLLSAIMFNVMAPHITDAMLGHISQSQFFPKKYNFSSDVMMTI